MMWLKRTKHLLNPREGRHTNGKGTKKLQVKATESLCFCEIILPKAFVSVKTVHTNSMEEE